MIIVENFKYMSKQNFKNKAFYNKTDENPFGGILFPFELFKINSQCIQIFKYTCLKVLIDTQLL